MLKNDKFALEGNKSEVVRRSVLTHRSGPHFKKSLRNAALDNRLTNDGKVVGPTHRPRSTPHKHYFSASDNHFC
jgi:hypothetical protein